MSAQRRRLPHLGACAPPPPLRMRERRSRTDTRSDSGRDERWIHRDGDNGSHESRSHRRTLELLRLRFRWLPQRPLRPASLAGTIPRGEGPFKHLACDSERRKECGGERGGAAWRKERIELGGGYRDARRIGGRAPEALRIYSLVDKRTTPKSWVGGGDGERRSSSSLSRPLTKRGEKKRNTSRGEAGRL